MYFCELNKVVCVCVCVCGGGFSLGSSWSDSLAQHLVFQYSIINVLKNQMLYMYFCVTRVLLYVLLLLEIGDYYCSILCGVVCVIVYVMGVVFCLSMLLYVCR